MGLQIFRIVNVVVIINVIMKYFSWFGIECEFLNCGGRYKYTKIPILGGRASLVDYTLP